MSMIVCRNKKFIKNKKLTYWRFELTISVQTKTPISVKQCTAEIRNYCDPTVKVLNGKHH